MDYVKELQTLVKGTCLINEPMSRHTSYCIGGPVNAFITPKDKQDLSSILKFASTRRIPTYFVGSGTNLLVADSGIDGIVITLSKSFNRIVIDGTHIYAEAGVTLGRLVKNTIRQKLTGLENLIGIPGTLGGALTMNAGAFGEEISNHLISVELMNMDGTPELVKGNEINFGYRSSAFHPDKIILTAEFELMKSDSNKIQLKSSKASRKRRDTQPLKLRSAGSVFKNPKNVSAGYLIDQAGLKGIKSGDAEISVKHANFFVNHGNAKAKDMAILICLARKTVQEKFGIKLELEINTLGFKPGSFNA